MESILQRFPMLRNRWFIGSEVRYLHFGQFVFIVLKSSKWRNKFNTTEKGEIEKKKAIKKKRIYKIDCFTLWKHSSYRPKAALLPCKTAAFASLFGLYLCWNCVQNKAKNPCFAIQASYICCTVLPNKRATACFSVV